MHVWQLADLAMHDALYHYHTHMQNVLAESYVHKFCWLCIYAKYLFM